MRMGCCNRACGDLPSLLRLACYAQVPSFWLVQIAVIVRRPVVLACVFARLFCVFKSRSCDDSFSLTTSPLYRIFWFTSFSLPLVLRAPPTLQPSGLPFHAPRRGTFVRVYHGAVSPSHTRPPSGVPADHLWWLCPYFLRVVSTPRPTFNRSAVLFLPWLPCLECLQTTFGGSAPLS